MEDEQLAFYGGAVKALGDGKVGGYLVRFGDQKDTDLEGDFFSKETDLGVYDQGTLPVYYQHGHDGQLKSRKIGRSTCKYDDVGLWAEAQLELRDEYEQYIYQMAADGKLGWSSGAAGHLVEREQVGKAYHIKVWVIAEASLTPTPAEPRNCATPIKSLYENTAQTVSDAEAAQPAQSDDQPADKPTNTSKEKEKMDITKEELESIVDGAVTKSLDEFKKTLPAPDNSGVSVIHDEADTPFKSIAEQCMAVKTAKLSEGQTVHPRLKALSFKANGATEGVPSEGGYLLDPTISAEMVQPIHDSGVFTQYARKLPVGNNSNSGHINGVDETSRATGSRWGGIRGYRLAEGATITSSKPKFKRINWELKKYAVLCYATDELLQDSAMFNEILRIGSMEELNFMANDDLVNGNGIGGPLGVLNSPAKITVARDTASKVLHVDLVTMWQRMLPRFRNNAVWFINSEVEPQLDQIYFTGTTSVLSPYVTYTPEGVMRIKGRPVVVTEFNPALNAAGDILLADFSQYLFWDKTAQAATSIHVAFTTDEQAFRFVYRCDGQTVDSSPITPYKGTNNQSAFVSLGAATAA